MTSRKIDFPLILFGVLLILFSSYRLFITSESALENFESLGSLTQTRAVVKTKVPTHLGWKDAFIDSILFEDQLIYTDSRSAAGIKFFKGDELSIGEKSLIRLKSGHDLGVKLERGVILAKLAGKEPLTFEINGKEYELKGNNSDIQISMSGDKSEIGVLKGEVTVSENGESETLTKKTALIIQGNQKRISNVLYTLESPLTNQVVYSSKVKTPILFKWSPSKKAEVLVSRNYDLENAVSHLGEGEVKLDLEESSYFWKVVSEDGSSLIGTFSVYLEKPPVIIRPLDGEKIHLKSDENLKVLLQWEGSPNQDYLVEWKTDQITSQKTSGSAEHISISKNTKNFEWRVKLEDAKRPEAVWSKWQKVFVDIHAAPQTPQNLFPHESTIQSYREADKFVNLSWVSDFAAEVEVTFPDGKQEVFSVASPPMKLLLEKEGKYSWRVRSVDVLSFSFWTELKNFTFIDSSNEKDLQFQRIELKRPDQQISFAWESSGSEKSFFELSKDQDFNDVVVKKEVLDGNIQIKIPEVGTYFWRSKSVLPDGSQKLNSPVRVIIDRAPPPSQPKPLPKLEVPIEWDFKENSSGFFDWLIPSAYAEEIIGKVNLSLPAHEDVKKYSVRIFRDAELKNLILEKEIEGSQFEWKNVSPGKYHWQYALIDYWDRVGPYSEASELIVLSSERPVQERAKLLFPIRGQEVDLKDLKFQWKRAEGAKKYHLKISDSRDFKNIIFEEKTTALVMSPHNLNLESKLYYWKVLARNNSGHEVKSSTGRFVILPPLERIIIQDQHNQISYWPGIRSVLSWTPSVDKYSFKGKGREGEISGTATQALELQTIIFRPSFIITAEASHQGGKVFDDEDYIYQKISGSFSKRMVVSEKQFFGIGLSLGIVSGTTYDITNSVVKGERVLGPTYGPTISHYYSFNQSWQILSAGTYFFGEIKQLELSFNVVRKFQSFFLSSGVGMSSRNYSDNEGAQSSLKLLLGLGKDF